MLLFERLPVAFFSALLTLLLGGALLLGVVFFVETALDPISWVLASWMWKVVLALSAMFFVFGLAGRTTLFEAIFGRALRAIKLMYFFH